MKLLRAGCSVDFSCVLSDLCLVLPVTKAALSEIEKTDIPDLRLLLGLVTSPAVKKHYLLLFEEFAVCVVQTGRFLIGRA